MPAMLKVGSTFKDYRLLELVGSGGAGSVYRALQTTLNRVVALKVVQAGNSSETQSARRFLREALALARLSHPSIVPIYDFGEEGPWLFYSMEFAPGLSLDRQLEDGRPVDPDKATRILAEVLEALDAVHAIGVFHRDIKPANVLQRPTGGILLSDFGLAQQQDATRMTRQGCKVGTLPFFPPETLRGEEYDARGDLYQCGVTLYQLLTTVTPYTSSELMDAMRGVALDLARPIRRIEADFDPKLAGFLRKAIQPGREDRFQSAREMRNALPLAVDRADAAGLTVRSGGKSKAVDGRLRGAGVRTILRHAESPLRVPVPATRPGSRPGGWRALVLPVAGGGGLVLLALLIALLSGRGGEPGGRSPEPRESRPGASASAGTVSTGTASSAALPVSTQPERDAFRVAGVEQLRRRLLDQTTLALSPVAAAPGGLFVGEVVVPMVAELESARLVWEQPPSASVEVEVNGTAVAECWRRFPPAVLLTGNNRIAIRGAASSDTSPPPTLWIRRRAGAGLRPPPPGPGVSATATVPASVVRWIAQADRDFQAGKWSEAIRDFERATAAAPPTWQLNWKKAAALHYATFVSRGFQAIGRGLEFLSPVDEDPELWRLQEYRSFNEALRVMPSEGGIWFDLGRSYRDYRRTDDAERAFALSCLLQPRAMQHWFDLSTVLLDQVPKGQERSSPTMQLAVTVARAAFVPGPEIGAPLLLQRALLFKRAGLADEARRDCAAALERSPTDGRARELSRELGR